MADTLSEPSVDLAANGQPAEASVQSLADPSYSTNNSSISTVPEDGDEAWASAPEPVDTDDEASEMPQIIESDGRSSRTSTHCAPSGLPPVVDVDKLKNTQVSGKDLQESVMTAALEDSQQPSPTHDETLAESDERSTAHASPLVAQNTVSSSRTASVSGYAASSVDITPSSSHTRPTSPAPTSQSASALERRQTRRRSVLDGRTANRFSGFLSNLMHRRPERDGPASSPGRRTDVEEQDTPVAVREGSSRASSPSPPARPITPPPPIPAPSLQELGLNLTAISSILTPSHFSTPPSNGTFLKPHYLLLCHSQGLDVLPLVSPPAPQPYALVRRVSFKCVVVMEEKGVLVAIAGRRDGVRVYALEDVKKAVEWRVGVEIRREAERQRREEAKRGASGGVDKVFGELISTNLDKSDKSKIMESPSTPTPSTPKVKRRPSVSTTESSKHRPRPPTTGKRLKPRTPSKEVRTNPNDGDPPPYQSPPSSRSELPPQPSVISVSQSRSRSGSVNNVLAGPSARRRSAATVTPKDDEKADWDHYSSDEEAINMATAGHSGSAALDERTSAANNNSHGAEMSSADGLATTLDISNLTDTMRRADTSQSMTSAISRRSRPAQLDLALNRTMTNSSVSRPPPSPTPSIWTLRQALAANPPGENSRPTVSDNEDDEDDGVGEDSISFAEALAESRMPDLPPPGTQHPQEAILIVPDRTSDETQSPPETVDARSVTTGGSQSRRSRRRWSVFDGVFAQQQSASTESVRSSSRSNTPAAARPSTPSGSFGSGRTSDALTRITSADASSLQHTSSRGHNSIAGQARPSTANLPPTPVSASAASTSSHHRFLPKLITNAFNGRRSDDQSSPGGKSQHNELLKRSAGSGTTSLPPAPKLEYVKLPGTKGAVLIKAVETAKKSFLAILCGEHGEKVELFAGTYRTTLGLSRTFILPDSPRSLELQLQGDDLVEVFLVFAQNVFGLEPATVRVREVRVGRAERRAARRRARENRSEELLSTEATAPTLGDGDAADTSMSVGITLAGSATSQTFDENMLTPPPMSRQVSDTNLNASAAGQQNTTSGAVQSDELTAIAAAQLAPYSTFQQLSFAPNFPLATIADECIIPPTYRSFLEYRAKYEPKPEGANNQDLANVQFSPPGLPVPQPLPPSRWFYQDPKGLIQGPWKASLMQTWYKERLLPPDLPVRREEDTEFILLKDLRAQCVDPTHPFRSTPPALKQLSLSLDDAKPLLDPISLLTQPRRYGPPALFYTTRGGHSTSVVDARGRSVLRGRLRWSTEDDDNFSTYGGGLGDVKRLEAFDVKRGAVIIAIRRGGLEALDVGDALENPGDHSRSVLPNYKPNSSTVSRRPPFVWKVGSPLSAFAIGPVASVKASKDRTPSKKYSLGNNGKSPAKSDFALGNADDYEGRQEEELLFLGRSNDNVYFCERSNGSFRILRLRPIASP